MRSNTNALLTQILKYRAMSSFVKLHNLMPSIHVLHVDSHVCKSFVRTCHFKSLLKPRALTYSAMKGHLIGIRYQSTETGVIVGSKISTLNDSTFIPPIPPVVPPEIPPITEHFVNTEALSSLVEPSLSSLGLCRWTPAGMVQKALEILHINLDLPWWGSIVIGTICLRVLIFPLIVIMRRNTIHMMNVNPEMSRLNRKLTSVKKNGTQLEIVEAMREYTQFQSKNNISYMKSLTSWFQAPIFVSVFYGIRGMTNAPVESMTDGGVFWFIDLTTPDPYYVLPLISMATLFCIIEVGADGFNSKSVPPKLKMFVRLIPVILLPFISRFSSAMLCYWVASNTCSLIQVLIMRIPSVAESLKIPKMVEHPPASVDDRSLMDTLRTTWNESRMLDPVQKRDHDEKAFRRAGTGPLQKTYLYDPTKIHPPLKTQKKIC